MADITYITGTVKSAAVLTGITGAQTFAGQDTQGPYFYDARLNSFILVPSILEPSDIPEYDYVVQGTGGLKVRTAWVANIQTQVFWAQVPIDTKVQVSQDNVNWKDMYFAQYDPNSPDGKFYYVYVAGRTSFSTIGGNEATEITCLAAVGLNSKYFIIHSTTTAYYVWFNVDSNGVSPAALGGPLHGLAGFVSMEVKLASTDDASMVATKLQVVMNSGEFQAMISPASNIVVAVVVVAAGKVYDPQVASSGLNIVVKVQGGDIESYFYARLA